MHSPVRRSDISSLPAYQACHLHFGCAGSFSLAHTPCMGPQAISTDGAQPLLTACSRPRCLAPHTEGQEAQASLHYMSHMHLVLPAASWLSVGMQHAAAAH